MQNKKAALVAILEILKKHSSPEHPLNQQDIGALLERDYQIQLERKAIGSSIKTLNELGYETETITGGTYLIPTPFDESELRLIIDGIIGSKYISASYARQLIKKLCGCTNKYFDPHAKYVYAVDGFSRSENKALFYNIEIIHEAISKKKKIKYIYNKYDVDMKMHKTSTQIVSPYHMIHINKNYYLMAYSEYWKNIVYHRIDHMSDLAFEDGKPTAIRNLPEYKNGLDMKSLVSTLPYPYADKSVKVKFIADKSLIDQIIEWFGRDINISNNANSPDQITVSLKVSPMAMKYWALQYVSHVEVVHPESLRREIKNILNDAARKYK